MRAEPAIGVLAVTNEHLNDQLQTGRGIMPLACALDLPGFCGERLAHFPCLSLEGDGALEAER